MSTVVEDEILLSNIKACSNNKEPRDHDTFPWLVRSQHFEIKGDLVNRHRFAASEILQNCSEECLKVKCETNSHEAKSTCWKNIFDKS